MAACMPYSPMGPPSSAAVARAVPSCDQLAVPAGPVLLGQRDERAALGRACRPARLGQEHEREEPRRLRLVGQQLVEQAAETDGLRGQIGVVKVGAAHSTRTPR